MKARTRELIRYGEECGFTVEGLDGHGHYVLTHPNGERIRVAATPGDYRGDENNRALMRRLSGITPKRAKSGRYRKGVGTRGRFSMTDALEEKAGDTPESYTVDGFLTQIPEREPAGLLRLRAELERLQGEFQSQPSNAIAVKIRDVETRIRIGVYE